jgi:protein ImuB
MRPGRTQPVRTLVVACPDWPVTAAGHRPTDPVVVVAEGRVVACSAAARAAGVRTGVRRREAQACCPEAVVVAADPAREVRAFEPVVRAVEEFVPAVEVIEPGTCAFATRGPSRYFGGDEALAAAVAERVAGLVPCRTGVADGLFAAVLAARSGCVVPPGESARFLAPFPVEVLGDPELAGLLVRLGIRTLGELAALPHASVLARFGAAGARAHRLASGLDERLPAPRAVLPDLSVAVELDPPVERVDAAAFAAKSLADELCARLARRGLACERVRIEVATAHGESLVRRWRHAGATPAALAERVRWQLDGWIGGREGPTAGLTLIRLVPEGVGPDRGRQQGFWGDGTAPDRVARALARVQGMLGPDAVVTGVPGGGRSPAEWVAHRPFVPAAPEDDPGGGPGVGLPWPGAPPPPAPARVHVPPLQAALHDERGAPVRVSGRGAPSAPPARLTVAGGPAETVVAWAGPWLLEERWWDPRRRTRRARWQVQTATGRAYLVALERGRCLVEATYD